jgi:hypothetical protein
VIKGRLYAIGGEKLKNEFLKWLKQNEKQLREFINLRFNINGFDWLIDYKITYSYLNTDQKKLSDELWERLKLVVLNSN